MTPQKRASYRKRLEALKREVRPVRIEENRKEDGEDAQALSEMLQAIGSQRNKGNAELLARIERALRKIADEPADYGLCDECGEEIAPKRLELMPYASLCTACQAARDPQRGGPRRKITDYT